MKDVIVQIYGIRTLEDARMAVGAGAEHIGVSYGMVKRTPGQLTCPQARVIFEGVQHNAVRIGLTVSTNLDEIMRDLQAAMPDVLHLSGDIDRISPAQIADLKGRFPALRIMQAIPVLQNVPLEHQSALEYIRAYESVSDFFLIDTMVENADDIGATGLTHDRSVDRAIVEATGVRCIIAGGLNAHNVKEAIVQTHPYGVDSFTHTNYEDERADTLRCKDPERVRAFVEAARHA